VQRRGEGKERENGEKGYAASTTNKRKPGWEVDLRIGRRLNLDKYCWSSLNIDYCLGERTKRIGHDVGVKKGGKK